MDVKKAIEVLRSNGYAVNIVMDFFDKNRFSCATVRSHKWPDETLVKLWSHKCAATNHFGKEINDEIRRIENLVRPAYHEGLVC